MNIQQMITHASLCLLGLLALTLFASPVAAQPPVVSDFGVIGPAGSHIFSGVGILLDPDELLEDLIVPAEMAIFDTNGILLVADRDEITVNLPQGEYFLVVAHAGMTFADGFVVDGDSFEYFDYVDVNVGDRWATLYGSDEAVRFEVSSSVLGDVNQDGVVDFLDITPFVEVLASGTFLEQADCNQDGLLNFLDIAPFIAILSS